MKSNILIGESARLEIIVKSDSYQKGIVFYSDYYEQCKSSHDDLSKCIHECISNVLEREKRKERKRMGSDENGEPDL